MFSIGLLLDEVSVEKYICEYVGNFQGTFSSFLQAAAPACFVFLFSKNSQNVITDYSTKSNNIIQLTAGTDADTDAGLFLLSG